MTSVALLGVAHIHAPNFIQRLKKRSDVVVKGVYDHDAARGQRRADELGVPFVADYKELLKDKELGGVIICSETNRHEELVLAAARAKKAMFVEKPMGLGSRDGYKMAAAIEKAGVIFQTGYFMRGDANLRFVREQVQAGVFGKITRIRGSNCHSGALGGWFDTEWRWMADPEVAGCGAYGDLGTHLLDIMIWLMGDVDSATAVVNNGTGRYGDCDETGEGILKFANGAIGTLAAAWDDLSNPCSFMLSGTEAHAAIIHGKLYFARGKAAGDLRKRIKDLEATLEGKSDEQKQAATAEMRKSLALEEGREPISGVAGGQPHAFELFLDALDGKEVALVGAREAAYRSAVAEALYEGARKNKWVAPKPDKSGKKKQSSGEAAAANGNA